MGFFSKTPVKSQQPLALLPQCGSCGLFKAAHCKSPKMPVTGEGRRGILITGEGPGFNENEQNKQFVGKTGQYLRKVLRELGVEPDEDCWFTNAVICWTGQGNPTPTDNQIVWCRPNLTNTIAELNPKVIILLGKAAVKSLIGSLWKKDVGEMGRWVGFTIPCQKPNAWIAPTFHPSHVVRAEDEPKGPVTAFWFKKHLEVAVSFTDRPWAVLPLYEDKVRIELDTEQAAKTVRRMTERGNPVAWDLETSSLKPDGKDSYIYSCALSDGMITVAYPWQGAAIQATKEFLASDTPKIGFSAKFDHRWAKAKLNQMTRNWLWDGMLAAHTLDNRSRICSLDFQSFVMLGQPQYKDETQAYLKSEGGGYSLNRIKKIDLNVLLKRNGLDALLEYYLALKQMKEMGFGH